MRPGPCRLCGTVHRPGADRAELALHNARMWNAPLATVAGLVPSTRPLGELAAPRPPVAGPVVAPAAVETPAAAVLRQLGLPDWPELTDEERATVLELVRERQGGDRLGM